MVLTTLRDDQKFGLDFQDQDHQLFVNSVTELHQSANDTAISDTELCNLFDELLRHSREHFFREEEVMLESDFFAFGCHKSEHDRVLKWFEGIAGDVRDGDGRSELADLLENEVMPWFDNHLSTMDLVTARFVLSWKSSRVA